MLRATGLDDCHASGVGLRIIFVDDLTLKHKGHCEDGLESVALSAPGRRAIGLSARNADRIVEDRLDGGGIDAASVVLDCDRSILYVDGYYRSGLDLLT